MFSHCKLKTIQVI